MSIRPSLTLCAAITADGKFDAGAHPDDFPRLPGDVLFELKAGDNPAKRLRELRARDGVRRVVCYSGSQVFRRLLEDQLVAEIFLLIRPVIDGRRGAATLSGPPGKFFPESIRCRLLKMEVLGQECLLHYRVGRTRAKRKATV